MQNNIEEFPRAYAGLIKLGLSAAEAAELIETAETVLVTRHGEEFYRLLIPYTALHARKGIGRKGIESFARDAGEDVIVCL